LKHSSFNFSSLFKFHWSILHSIALMFQVSFWHSSFHWYCGS
jgi:hypothetical protein